MRKLTIGITFRDDQPLHQTWWGSGIGQNIKFYYDLFELMGHEPLMVLRNPLTFEFNGKTYKTVTLEKILEDKKRFDLYLEAGITLKKPLRTLLQGVYPSKIVGLRCGHDYFAMSEGFFVKRNIQGNLWYSGQDRIWILPHHAKQAGLLTTLHGCPADVVPYIWEPDFVERTFVDVPRAEQPDIYILEPNLSVAKNAIIPMAILQNLYERKPGSFGRAYIGNSGEFYDKDYFLQNFVVNLPVLRAESQKVFFIGRFTINQLFKKPDILLGFQHDNELNYLYNEAIYMGLPLVHNSPAYAEVGYYYPDMDVRAGADQLLLAAEGKSPLSGKVIEGNRDFLYRFSIHNPEVQGAYQKLLEQVMDDAVQVK